MLVRCEDHPSKQKQYSHIVDAVGHPDTAAICGRCDKAGRILPNEKEWKAYRQGQRIFSFNSYVMKVRAG